MSERRRIFSSTRLNENERAFGKENICDLRQSNKLAGTNSQKALSSKKSYPSDIGGPCYCNMNKCNDIINNNAKTSTKKTPFRIHFDRAGNDLNKGVRVRERIIEYDTRRIEELKRNTRFSENKFMLWSKRGFYTKKQQSEVNLAQDLQSFKENRKPVPNSFASSCNKATVRSDKTIFDLKLPKPQISITKSLVDLSQESKQSTFVNNVRDVSKQDLCPRKSTYVEKKELVVTTSHLRSRSCSNQRTVVVTRSRIASTSSTNEAFVDLQKKQSGFNKCKAFDGDKDSLFGGFSTILSSDTLKNQAISKGSNKSDSLDILICRGKRLYDKERQPLVDTIPSKVRGKVKDWEIVKQNTDFSPYLLYHSDYLVDLLTIEKEKEDNSLKLSSGFIDKYANNEPRNIIVAFLIHLATHCRYPSFILYQAVKLFDNILDKIPIDITDMQLAAITALWIVLKKDSNFNNISSVATVMLALIPDQQYTNVDILAEWERVVLRSLKFNISFSDPFSIFVFYVINCDYDQDKISSRTITKIYYCGGYIIDLTLLDVSFSCITSNHLALAAAELVMCIVLDNDLSNPRWHFWRSIITNGINIPIRIYDDEINVLRSTMISHVLESEKKHTKEETVKKRYSHNRYGNISNFLLEKIKKIPPENYSISM